MVEGLNACRNEAVVIISSDEDEAENVQELFQEFVSKVERFVEQNDVVLFLRLKFAEARSEFVSSAKFKNALKWRTGEMDKSNGYIFTGDICKLLATDPKTDVCKVELDLDEKINVDLCTPGKGRVSSHGTRTRVDADANKVTIESCEPGDCTTDEGGKPAETPQPSTSTAKSSSSSEVNGKIKKKKKRHEIPSSATSSTASPSKQPLTPRKRKRLVKRLELKLKDLAERIKIFNQAELSLDEMEMSDSMYIQECRLKDKFNRIWDKICKVQGRPPDTGRVTEKEVKCPTTGVPAIDRAIKKFLKKKKGRFPDKFDVSNVVLEANKKYGLKLSTQMLNEISDEVFMCVGNTLQKRRKRDFHFNFGCHLTDDCSASNDPAMTDAALRKKLEENKRINKRNLDEIFNKFTHYGRMKAHDSNGNSSSSDLEEEKPEKSRRVMLKRKFSHISVTQSSDSSENECDDLDLREDIDDNSDQIRSKEVFDASESDLEGFTIKPPPQVSEEKKQTESETRCDTESNTVLQSEDRNLRTNSAIVELPPSVLSRCETVSVEHTSLVEIDCTSQPSVTETVEKAGSSDKEDTSHVSVKDQDVTIMQQSVKNDVSKDLQLDESGMKLDSNVITISEEDLTTEPAEISSPSEETNSAPGHVLSNVGDSDEKVEDVTIEASGSSYSSNFVDSEVAAKHSPKENGTHDILPKSSPSMKGKGFNLNLSPSLSIPITPVSPKGLKILSLSTKKRKAENGSLEYESPLKIFRNATLEIVKKTQDSSRNILEAMNQKSSCNKNIASSEGESDELFVSATDSPPAQSMISGHSSLEKKYVSRRLPLSLNKTGRNSPINKQKTVERTVIVLSDDDYSDV